QCRLQRRRQIIAIKDLDFSIHPWVIETPYLPEVLVTVDDHKLPLPLGGGWGEGIRAGKGKVLALLSTNTLTLALSQREREVFRQPYRSLRAVWSRAYLHYPVLARHRIRAQTWSPDRAPSLAALSGAPENRLVQISPACS